MIVALLTSHQEQRAGHGFVSTLRTYENHRLIVLNSNILFLPFRRTQSISLSTAIKQYISNKYDQHPDMFIQDLEAIDRMRTEAVTSLEAHNSGIKKLAAYAAQLVWIGGKFPIDVR